MKAKEKTIISTCFWSILLQVSIFKYTCVYGENPLQFTLETRFIVIKLSKFTFEYIKSKIQ